VYYSSVAFTASSLLLQEPALAQIPQTAPFLAQAQKSNFAMSCVLVIDLCNISYV